MEEASSISALPIGPRKVPSGGSMELHLNTVFGIKMSRITIAMDGGVKTARTLDMVASSFSTTFHAGIASHLSARSSIEMSIGDLVLRKYCCVILNSPTSFKT